MKFLTANVIGGLSLLAAILFFISAWIRPGARGLNLALGVVFFCLGAFFIFKWQ
jgi:hypothetical protein